MALSQSWQYRSPTLNAGAIANQPSVNLRSLSITQGAKLTENPFSLPDAPLFGTDGIRGNAEHFLTRALVTQVGFWAGQVLQTITADPGPVIIGQDSRNSSQPLAAALTAGLTAAGLEVWALGLCPTPAVAYLTQVSAAIGGVMISASHNPPEDNGIKIFGQDGSKLSQAAQETIETALRTQTLKPMLPELVGGKVYPRSELLTGYLSTIQKPLQAEMQEVLPLRGVSVVLDLAWGAMVHVAPQAFRNLGAEVVCLHGEANGDRINVDCGSTHLASLQAAVLSRGADIGFAFDGDGDRVLAVDNHGQVVNGDHILYFWGQQLQRRGQLPNNLLVTTVMANLGFQRAWEQNAGTLIRTAVGDQYVYAEMLRSGAMLGGEQSGHILCRQYGVTGDGLVTALHLAALVKQSGVSLAELVNQSFQPYPQQLCNVRVEDRNRRFRWQECEALQQAIAHVETAIGDQGRVLVRASGTEPLLRIMVEAKDRESVSFWTHHLMQLAQQHLSD